MAIFRKIGRGLGWVSTIAMTAGAGAGTYMGTSGLLFAALAFIGISSSATVVGIPVGIICGVLAASIAISVAIGTFVTSKKVTIDKFTHWGQLLDNKLEEKMTGKKFHLDEVKEYLDNAEQLLDKSSRQINRMHHKIEKLKEKTSNGIKINPSAGRAIIADATTQLKAYRNRLKYMPKNHGKQMLREKTIYYQLNQAEKLLAKASKCIKANKLKDPEFLSLEAQQLNKITELRTQVKNNYSNVEILKSSIKKLKSKFKILVKNIVGHEKSFDENIVASWKGKIEKDDQGISFATSRASLFTAPDENSADTSKETNKKVAVDASKAATEDFHRPSSKAAI